MAMELSFFRGVRNVDTSRDYTILVDMSGSMSGSRWKQVTCLVRYALDTVILACRLTLSNVQAREAVEHIAPHTCRCDPDGLCACECSNCSIQDIDLGRVSPLYSNRR